MERELAEHLPLRLDMLDGKYPSNTSKINQRSPLFLFVSTRSLISPTLGCSRLRFICLYLRLHGTTLTPTPSIFTKNWIQRAALGIEGSTSMPFFFPILFFSFFPLLASGTARGEKERVVAGGGGEEPLLACIFIRGVW